MYPLKIDLFIDENCDKTIAQILIERGYVKVIRNNRRLNLFALRWYTKLRKSRRAFCFLTQKLSLTNQSYIKDGLFR